MVRCAIRPALVVVFCAVVLAGCGDSGESGSPLDNALGYLPEDAPLVITIGTDPEGGQIKAIQKILDRFPFSEQVTESLEESLSEEDLDYDKDVKPLLGNDFVVGAPDVQSVVDDAAEDEFVGAIEAGDADALEDLIKRDEPKEIGESKGATLYEDSDGDAFAIEDGVLVVAGSRKLLDAALEQRDSDGGLTEETFNADTEGVPEDGLVRVSADVEALIASDPDAEEAQKVKWVSALRTFGMAVSFEDDRTKIDFRMATDPEGLTEADLPMAAGSESPAVIDSPSEIGLGLRGPEQLLTFGESAAQAVDPSGFGDYSTAKKTLESQLDLSFEEDLFEQLEDDLSVSFALDGTFGVRAAVKDPQAFKQTLNKLGTQLPDIVESAVGEPIGYAKPKRGEDFYALATADGDSVVYGVVDGVFVLANDSRRASRLAEDEVKPVDGAKGAFAMSADAEQLVTTAISQFGGSALGSALGGALYAEPVDTLTGSMEAETDGLTGTLELTFD